MPKNYDERYQVREENIEDYLREISEVIINNLPTNLKDEQWGFTLFLFSYGKQGLPNEGEAGAIFYISSAERSTMIEALKEFIKKEEKAYEDRTNLRQS